MNQQIINVKGMTCNHCKASVESNLNKLDFVDAVEVDLASGHVKITGQSIDLDAVEKLIDSIGYSVEK
jgi:copper chaperone CopZ